jgi:glycogen(starch) synthase
MNALHLINNSLPYRDGYAVRTHYILRFQKEKGYCVTGMTLPGVQSRMLGKIGLASDPVEQIDGVFYYHFAERQQMIVRLAKKLFAFRFMERFKTRASAVYHVPDSESRGIFSPIVASHRRKALTAYYLPIARSIPALDLIHAHWPPLNAYYALALARECHVPFVYEVRCLFEDTLVAIGDTEVDSPIYSQRRQADTIAAQNADSLITISEQLKRDFVKRGIPEWKISVVPNGVDSKAFVPRPRDEELAERHRLHEGVVIGFVGSIKRYEGLEYLLHALPLIQKSVPQIKALIVGSGPELDALKALADELEISPVVHFSGEVLHSDVQRYYSLIDVFVIPRPNQRVNHLVTPLKPYEAMAMEKALLVSDVGGLTEIVQEGKTGLSFKTEDVADLAQKAILLLGDTSLRHQLGKQARAWVAQERDWRIVIDRYHTIYGKTLERYAKRRMESD